jgi:hypothetical protein
VEKMRNCSGGGLGWLKHNVGIGILPRQQSHWPTSGHTNNEGKEWQSGYAKGKVLKGWGG